MFVVVDRSADAASRTTRQVNRGSAGMRDDIAAVITRYPAARFALVGLTAHEPHWTGRCPVTCGACSRFLRRSAPRIPGSKRILRGRQIFCDISSIQATSNIRAHERPAVSQL